MTIATIFEDLRLSLSGNPSTAVSRHIEHGGPLQLKAYMRGDDLLPQIQILVGDDHIPSANIFQLKGLKTYIGRSVDDQPALYLQAAAPEYEKTFCVLCDDLVSLLHRAPTRPQAILQMFERIGNWKIFMTDQQYGSPSQDEVVGLLGELLALRDTFAPRIGIGRAVEAWRGPAGGTKDFEFGTLAVEVKCSAARRPELIQISSVEQLDHQGFETLVLHYITLRQDPDMGESLSDVVGDISAAIGDDFDIRSRFDNNIMSMGVSPQTLEHQISTTRYSLSGTAISFEVREGFPRYTLLTKEPGTENLTYAIRVGKCMEFTLPLESLRNLLEPSK